MSVGRRWGIGCFTAISLPFALGGVLGGAVLVQHLHGWLTTRGYVSARCTIDFVTLHEMGTDEPGYEVLARYRYPFGGREFMGTRTHFGWGGDSGDFHRRLYEDMEAHRLSGEPMPCFVDPGHPEQSVINRDLRLDMVALSAAFLLIFGGIGLAGLRLAWTSARHLR